MIQQQRTTALLLGAALLISGAAQSTAQQVYKVTDKAGNVVYTDRPPGEDSGAIVEAIELKGIVTQPSTQTSNPDAESDGQAVSGYRTEIQNPLDGATITSSSGDFDINATTEPGLSSGEKLQLKLNGSDLGDPQVTGRWQLTNVFPGDHTITIDRLDGEGNVVNSAEPIRIRVLRQ